MNGWACNGAIENQINGVPGTEYKDSNAIAPIITWGFYQQADSLPRRTDALSWRSFQTADGMHATTVGRIHWQLDFKISYSPMLLPVTGMPGIEEREIVSCE